MAVSRSFKVFGELVEIVVGSDETGRSFSMVTQVSPPGGGPPPHSHTNEDELFTVIEGEFELFDGETWHRLRAGETSYALRGGVHTFRNCGTTDGKLQIVVVPGTGFENYLEEISALKVPEDMARVLEISAMYGIRFVGTGEAAPAVV